MVEDNPIAATLYVVGPTSHIESIMNIEGEAASIQSDATQGIQGTIIEGQQFRYIIGFIEDLNTDNVWNIDKGLSQEDEGFDGLVHVGRHGEQCGLAIRYTRMVLTYESVSTYTVFADGTGAPFCEPGAPCKSMSTPIP